MARRKNISKSTRSVLALLLSEPETWWYGYNISKETSLKSGSLYPILMRLSEQGFLESKWQASDKPGRPPRHMYRLTYSGFDLARRQACDESFAFIGASV